LQAFGNHSIETKKSCQKIRKYPKNGRNEDESNKNKKQITPNLKENVFFIDKIGKT
jgi:hypothetical protein